MDPRPVWTGPVKRNEQTIIMFCLAITVWTFTSIRIGLFRRRQAQVLPAVSAVADKTSALIDKQSLANLGTILTHLLFYIPAAVIVVSLNRMIEPEDLQKYPNYLLIYFLNHHVFFLWNLYTIFIFFSKSKSLRDTIFREFKQKLSCFR